jgi:hypothetical protein
VALDRGRNPEPTRRTRQLISRRKSSGLRSTCQPRTAYQQTGAHR